MRSRSSFGRRRDDDRADGGACGQSTRVEAASELSRAGVPKVEVELERAIRDWSRVPERSLVDRYTVDFPGDAVGLPLDLVDVEVLGSIESKLNLRRRAAISILIFVPSVPGL